MENDKSVHVRMEKEIADYEWLKHIYWKKKNTILD